MPNQVEFTFDWQNSGLDLNEETLEVLKDCFDKFQSDNLQVFEPKEMKLKFKLHGMDKSDPAMYSMMCWITDANDFSGTDGMTFDEFVNYAAYFFCQRHKEEGLKYVFQLFDKQGKGFLTKREFDLCCIECGISLEPNQVAEVFKKASGDGKVIKFSEFVYFMK